MQPNVELFAQAIGFGKPEDFKPQYLILSSVEGHGQKVTDPLKSIGIELIAPLALLAEIKELAERAIFVGGVKKKILVALSMGLEATSKVPKLVKWLSEGIARLFPPEYSWLKDLIVAFDPRQAIERGATAMRERALLAAKKGDILSATAKYMSAELVSDSAQKLYWSPLIQTGSSRD